MNINEKPEFYKLVSAALAYYRQDASEFALNVWWEGCKGFAYEQVAKALTKHATDPDKGQFAPKVADVVRQLGGTGTDRSLLAWGKVFAAMSEVGAYQDVDFQDAAIHKAISDMGGWAKLCRTESDQLSYTQHRFCECYRAYQFAGAQYDGPLIGDSGQPELYAKRGLPAPTPVVIGKPPESIRAKMKELSK
jgi:Domain of unknown function (DUF6475)